jgi:ABC-type phosphate transport system substrate-binding protein
MTGARRIRPLRAARTLAGAALCGLCLMTLASPSSGATSPATSEIFTDLHGEGAWSMRGELVQWQNELASAPSSVDLNYVPIGSQFGRRDLAAGAADFAVSGVPFQGDELSRIKGGAGGLIEAPIEVATLATFVEPPYVDGQAAFRTLQLICNPDDETTWPPNVTTPSQCVARNDYAGPVRIPNDNLAAMFLHYSGTTIPRLWAWNNVDVRAAMGLDPTTTEFQTDSLEGGPGFAGRSDPDEINYYLQQFIKQGAPAVWQGRIDLDLRIPWEPIGEHIPITVAGVTRDGAEQQVDQLANGGCGVTGACTPTLTGGIAPAPPSMLGPYRTAFPKQQVSLAQMKNANGDWVAPTPASITKAIAAGGETPLYALTHKVPGAFPLSWVDHLYAPAHGLSVEKTEGIATLIRYLATTGQEKAASVGEGRLSQALVAEALKAADDLVRSNCTGADRVTVDTDDPGPHAPATATAMRAIGTVLHCEPAPGATTTTVSPTTTPTFTSGGTDSSSATGTDNSAATSGSATAQNSARPTPASASSGADVGPIVVHTKRSTLLTTSKLPFPVPGGASGTDRLATFLLGAGLFLLVRKPAARVIRRSAL